MTDLPSSKTFKAAVIGNGIIDEELGSYIDEIPIVIRLNGFCIKGYESKVGQRTSIWCFASNVWGRYGEQFLAQKNSYESVWIIQRQIHGIAGLCEYDSDIRKSLKNKDIWIAPMQIDERIRLKINNSYILDDGTIGAMFPTTGIVALHAALERFGGPIFVAGMGSLGEGKTHHYYLDDRKASYANFICHDPIMERSILKQLIESGKIITLGLPKNQNMLL